MSTKERGVVVIEEKKWRRSGEARGIAQIQNTEIQNPRRVPNPGCRIA